jgi:DNA-binding transcriptional LysR family regulator
MLKEMRTFVAVAETGSIKSAARRLRLTQPAVTRQIQRLEGSLGATLLDRQVRPPVLAPAGRALLERCRQVLRSVEDLRAVATADAEPTGRFRLGIGPVFSDSTSLSPLMRLREGFPKLDLQVSSNWSAVMFEEVRAHRLDAAVGVWPSGTGSPPDLNARIFAEDRLVVCAAKGRAVGQRSLAELGRRAWVLNPDGCGYRAALRTALMTAGESLTVAIETPRLEMQLELVANALGIGLVPQWAFARSPQRKRLQAIRVPELELTVRYVIVDAGIPANFAPVLDTLEKSFAAALSRSRSGSQPRRTAPRRPKR